MASEIRVDKINSLSGVGTVTLSPTGVDISGITTAATLKATTGIVTTLTATTGIVTTLTTNTLTANSTAKVGTGVTLSPDGDIFATGVCTATSFSGDGSNLTGISVSSDSISEGNTKAEVVDTGAGHFKVETDGAERFRVDDNGKLTTGGETSPDVVDGGLCLNTGTQDGIFFSCKNSDIAHGRTSLDETDTLFSMRKISADKGGVDIRGYTDAAGSDPAIRIFGVIDDGTDATYCPVEIRGARKNTGGNTGTSGMGADKGVVRISNDGDNTVATFTGEGLCFHSDTATANALDDYEEGTFAIAAAGGSSVTFESNRDLGCYTKIGRQVTLSGQCQLVSSPSGTSVRIAIPFTSTNQSEEAGNFTGNVALYDYNIASGGEYVVIAVDNNSDYARFLNVHDNGAWTTLDVDGSAYLRFTVTYFTDS